MLVLVTLLKLQGGKKKKKCLCPSCGRGLWSRSDERALLDVTFTNGETASKTWFS